MVVADSQDALQVDSHPVRATLLVFSDDWGRHPSSCQHLIQRLRGRYEILWVNTIGMRPPTLGWSTVSRGLEKIRQWTKSRHSSRNTDCERGQGLYVLNPKMWPWFRHRHDRALNRCLLLSQLRKRLKKQAGPVIAITTIPIVADLMGDLPVDRWIYYCVDDFGTWPGLDQKPLAALERKVIYQADVLIAASIVLRNRLLESRDQALLLPHGVDLGHWSLDVPKHKSLEKLESPIVTFWGLVDRRMDVEFLGHLSRRMSRGTVALVGPEDNSDPALEQLPRVKRIPALPYEELPRVAVGTDALILPYRSAPVTQAMQPLKLLEYLATGKPVVATDLPATRCWSESLDLATTPEEFANAVLKRLETGIPLQQKIARQALRQESWEARTAEFESAIFS